MNELAQLVSQDIDFSILAFLFRPIEIMFVLGIIGGPVFSMWLFNQKACKDYGWLPVLMQCFSRVALDIGLVAGIAAFSYRLNTGKTAAFESEFSFTRG